MVRAGLSGDEDRYLNAIFGEVERSALAVLYEGDHYDFIQQSEVTVPKRLGSGRAMVAFEYRTFSFDQPGAPSFGSFPSAHAVWARYLELRQALQHLITSNVHPDRGPGQGKYWGPVG